MIGFYKYLYAGGSVSASPTNKKIYARNGNDNYECPIPSSPVFQQTSLENV